MEQDHDKLQNISDVQVMADDSLLPEQDDLLIKAQLPDRPNLLETTIVEQSQPCQKYKEPKKKEDDKTVAVNPEFDSLYEPEFNSKNAAFEKARSKLNSRVPSNPRGGTSGFGGGPGSYRGGRGGGPPKSTWSNQ